jgi:hypothetical protein
MSSGNEVREAKSLGTYRSFPDFLCARIIQAMRSVRRTMVKMESTLVRRDQFSITPQGIVHRPTDAAFTPNPGDPYSGIERLGQLRNKRPNGSGFRTQDVQRMMRELWAEYVAGNQQLFKK